MIFKAMLILFATLLVVTTRVSSYAEEHCAPAPSPKPHAPVPPVGPPTYAPLPPLTSTNGCTPTCYERCNTGKGKRECQRACTRCCKQCSCVPPGPRGTNMEKCGKCYSEVKYNGRTYKCP